MEPPKEAEPEIPKQAPQSHPPPPQLETERSRSLSETVVGTSEPPPTDVGFISPPADLPTSPPEGSRAFSRASAELPRSSSGLDTRSSIQSDEVLRSSSQTEGSSESTPKPEESIPAEDNSDMAESPDIEQGSPVRMDSQTDSVDNGDQDIIMGNSAESSPPQAPSLEPSSPADTEQPASQVMAIGKSSKDIAMRNSSPQEPQKESAPKDDSSGSSMDIGSSPIRQPVGLPNTEEPDEDLPTGLAEEEALEPSQAPTSAPGTSPEQEEENPAAEDKDVAMADSEDGRHEETLPSVLPVPGLWSVKIGRETSAVVVVEFVIDAETASKYGIDSGDTDDAS